MATKSIFTISPDNGSGNKTVNATSSKNNTTIAFYISKLISSPLLLQSSE